MSNIFVIGEILIDIVHQVGEESNKSEKFLGGSPANIAVTLGRLGECPTLITAFNGDDDLGKFALQELAKSGVGVTESSKRAPKTYTATAQIDKTGHATYEFDYSEEILFENPENFNIKALHAGSLSSHQKVYGPKIFDFYKRVHEDAITFYDPNIRPTIIPERTFVCKITEQFIAETDVAKVSDEDLEWLYPDVSPLESAQKWRKLGAKVVVVTLGSKGATAFFADKGGEELQVHIACPKVNVCDTVGAGDSFMGALISKLKDCKLSELTSEIMRETLEFCTKVSGITVSRKGANPPFANEI